MTDYAEISKNNKDVPLAFSEVYNTRLILTENFNPL